MANEVNAKGGSIFEDLNLQLSNDSRAESSGSVTSQNVSGYSSFGLGLVDMALIGAIGLVALYIYKKV